MQVIAIDWSGDRSGGRRKIWTAEASHGHLRELANGRTRDEVANYLIALAVEDPNLVVGFDFAFSMPAWFVRQQGASSGPEFWELVDQEGEGWLKSCPSPFFGHKGTKHPNDVELYRRTDLQVPAVEGRTPKSIFQIAGGGQVGPGSIRGMPILKRLSDEGFRIWPFDSPVNGSPLVLEIYPRLLTGPVVKKDREARLRQLRHYANVIGDKSREIASQDEDPFDAAVSAAVMNRYLNEIAELPEHDTVDHVEGHIWHPMDPMFRPGCPLPDYLDPALPDEPFLFVHEDGSEEGPFDPKDAILMESANGPDGTVGLPTGGTPRYLRVLQRDQDRVFTADGIWISLIPAAKQ